MNLEPDPRLDANSVLQNALVLRKVTIKQLFNQLLHTSAKQREQKRSDSVEDMLDDVYDDHHTACGC